MTTDELIAKLTDECRAFISAAKDDLHLHLIDVPWKNLIAHAEVLVALARQHKAWRHLDRDEEKPWDGETCLVYDAQFLEPYKATYGLHSNKFFSPMCVGFNPRWWTPLPSPPKEES